MTIFHLTAANDDVFGRHRHAPAIIISSRLNRDAIITGDKNTILDQHIATRFRITTVGVGTRGIRGIAFALNHHPSHGNIRAKQWMKLPHRRIPERDAFDQDILAAMRLDKIRPQITALTKHAFTYRCAFGDHLLEQSPCLSRAGVACFPTASLTTGPRPPVLAISLTIKHALAGNGHVLLLKRIYERRIVL